MKYTCVGGTNLKSSVLGFGCSGILGRVGLADSLRALAVAYEQGITLYDTARSYGYGESEAVLGKFLKGRRHSVIISTKFGIFPARQQVWKNAIKPVVRVVMAVSPSSRKIIRDRVASQFHKDRFSVQDFRTSLEESLEKLQTDYIDILFMHCPPVSALKDDLLMRELEKAKEAGKIRLVGISTEGQTIPSVLAARPPFVTALQFPCNVLDFSSQLAVSAFGNLGIGFFANHPFGGPQGVAKTRNVLAGISRDPETPRSIREKMSVIDDRLLAEIVLNVVTSGSSIDVVIPAMMSAKHLRTNIDAILAPRLTDSEIEWLRRRFTKSVSGNSANGGDSISIVPGNMNS